MAKSNANKVEAVEVVEAVVVVSKADTALVIFNEEAANGDEKLRARVIKRFVDELGMSKSGASTYFQNSKKKAAGGKVKHYYKAKNSTKPFDNSADDVPESFEVKLLDGNIKVFMSQQECDLFVESNPSLIDPDQTVEDNE